MKVLKFGAIWCPGCIIMKPRWKEIEEELPWLQAEYFDYDEDREMVESCNIGRDIPVFVFLGRDGKEFARMKGQIKKEDLVEFLKENKDR